MHAPTVLRTCPGCGTCAEPAHLATHAWRCNECDALVPSPREEAPPAPQVAEHITLASWLPNAQAIA